METWQALNVRPATGEGLISIVRFEPDDGCDRPPQMHNTFSGILGLIVPLFLAATIATAAPSAKAAEDRYIAARDAAIEKISAIYDAGNADDAARKAEDAASADLAAQMRAILNEPARDGFGPAKLNIDTFSKGDEGFGDARRVAVRCRCSGRMARRQARTAPTASMSSPRRISSSRRKRCSNAGCAPTRTGGARTSRTCRNRSARR